MILAKVYINIHDFLHEQIKKVNHFNRLKEEEEESKRTKIQLETLQNICFRSYYSLKPGRNSRGGGRIEPCPRNQPLLWSRRDHKTGHETMHDTRIMHETIIIRKNKEGHEP